MLYPTLWRNRGTSLWDDMFSLRRSFDRLFDRFSDGPAGDYDLGGWMPQVDIVDNENEVKLTAELPGFDPQEIDLSVSNGVLTISGERKQESEEGEEGQYRIRERRYGRFERSFAIPSTVDADKVAAEYTNGVLTVTLPIAEAAKPHRVKIKSGGGWKARLGAGRSEAA